jgi:glycosyltransferase involved in cell wall biosynthesis
MIEARVTGRVAIQQRVLPAYRVPFFERLATICLDELGVYAGAPLPQEQIQPATALAGAQFTTGKNRYFLEPSSRFFLCWQPGLVDWLADLNPEVLVVEANPRYRSSHAAIRWMHARQRPVLGWGLGAPAARGLFARLRDGERRAFGQSLDGMIAYSRQGAGEYRQLGIPDERVFVAPNAAAPAPTEPPPGRPAELKDGGQVLFVGRLQERKRLDLLFAACARLPEALQPQVTVVGDGPARAALEQAARSTYAKVRFTGDQRGQSLVDFFRGADLFVLPGTGGLAVQQALGYGLPVIVAQGDGTQADMVQDDNGWQVPPGDLQALTSALQQALSDPVRLRQMGAASYRIAVEQVNLEAMVAGFGRALARIQALGLRQG